MPSAWNTTAANRYRLIKPMTTSHFWVFVRLPLNLLASDSLRARSTTSAEESSNSMIASVNGNTSVLENGGFPRPKIWEMTVAVPIGFERVREQSVFRKNRQQNRGFQATTIPERTPHKHRRPRPQHPPDTPIVTFLLESPPQAGKMEMLPRLSACVRITAPTHPGAPNW